MSAELYPLIAGMLASGYAVAALFFLHFWARSRDRLFALFAVAFALLAVERLALVIATTWSENPVWVYLLRLLAFLLILVAIIDKNRPDHRRDG
jgi:hypothetical protein